MYTKISLANTCIYLKAIDEGPLSYGIERCEQNDDRRKIDGIDINVNARGLVP